MNRRSWHAIAISAVVVALLFASQPTQVRAATACDRLSSLALPKAKIDSTQLVDAGKFMPPVPLAANAENVFPKLPAFCRVVATLTPTADSNIKTEIWLPATGWNGKYQAVGNGGWAGVISYGALGAAVLAGYAGASTDTGHTANNADFAVGHPEKVIDMAYRSIHEMTVQAKSLITAHYGTPAKYSYYNGCSQGGRQGLAAAQKYPDDFNGIVAGAASWNQMRSHGARVALNFIVNQDADHVIPSSKYPMIREAVMNACDALDGLKDGSIENPQMCKFDYALLTCKAGDAANCLTKGQVASAKAMTSELIDPKTGKSLFDGHLLPGSELGWAVLGGPTPLALSVSGMKFATGDPNWDYHKMDIAADVERAANADNGAMYSGDPNLRPFFDRGGKLLMYHGWDDPQVNPMNSVHYYENVIKSVGKDKAANSIELFMIPEMNHCRGGFGTDTFDKMKPIEDWVEKAQKPTEIIASHLTNGQVDKTRPLCPYPQIAKYKGSGNPNIASSFMCANP